MIIILLYYCKIKLYHYLHSDPKYHAHDTAVTRGLVVCITLLTSPRDYSEVQLLAAAQRCVWIL